MNVLVVGGGSVGQVFGLHLARGGASVSFFVRAHQAAQARTGFVLHGYAKRGRSPTTERFAPERVLTDLDEVRQGRWDQVWFCAAATALDPPWFDELVRAIGDAVLVSLAPDMQLRPRLEAKLPAAHVVEGAIGLFAYAGPLPGESLSVPGTAYVTPLGVPSRFGGTEAPAVVAALRAGGLPARVDRRTRESVAFTSAVIQPLMLAYEGAGWTFEALFREDWLSLGARAAREAVDVTARSLQARRPLYRWLLQTSSVRLAFQFASRALPIDFETYLAVHFQKVRDQTHLLVPRYCAAGREAGIDTPSLAELLDRV